MGGSQSKSDAVKVPEIVRPAESVESKSDLAQALNSVAAEVYDNVHMQLGDIQNLQLEKTANMAKEIKERIAPIAATSGSTTICQEESAAVVACLKAENATTALCADIIDKLARCSSVSRAK